MGVPSLHDQALHRTTLVIAATLIGAGLACLAFVDQTGPSSTRRFGSPTTTQRSLGTSPSTTWLDFLQQTSTTGRRSRTTSSLVGGKETARNGGSSSTTAPPSDGGAPGE